MINELTNFILPQIEHFHLAGYWIAFVVALLETTVGIGLFLPGSTIILFLGALCARGYLDAGDLVWFAVLGAILGDNINYYLGKKYGTRWIEGGFWFFKFNHIEKTRNFMDHHGAKSVFLGRFIPSIKEIVPFIAGSVKMDKRTFMFWNILGAIGWGFEWIFAGYFFAQSISLAQVWLSRAGLFFALSVIIAITLYCVKLFTIKRGRQLWSIIVSLWFSVKDAVLNNEYVVQWTKKHPRFISFAQARVDKSQFSGLTLSIFSLSFIYVFSLFTGIVEDLLTSDPIVAADLRIANLVVALRTDTLTDIFTWITMLGKSQIILCFILILASLLWVWRKRYHIPSLLICVAGSEAFTYMGKLAFQRPRPALAVYAEQTFSFPSGHATIAVAFYGFVGYLLIGSVQSWKYKVNIFFTTLLIILSLGLSRIYLGVHYISDVWSGYLIGAMWLIIAISFSEWLKNQQKDIASVAPIKGAPLISAGVVFSAIFFYVFFSLTHPLPLASAPNVNPTVVTHITDIFTNEQIKYTETLIAERQEPLNFILLARDKEQLANAFKQTGWIKTDKADFSSFRKALASPIFQTAYPNAPIAPLFWNARIQDLSFSKESGVNWLKNARHVRIWATKFTLEDGSRIYLGMASVNNGLKWFIVPRIAPNLDDGREKLYQELSQYGQIENYRKIKLVTPGIGRSFTGDQFFTDGQAYIISLK